jgi:antitoxin component of MazEF toxin-antitoxin module
MSTLVKADAPGAVTLPAELCRVAGLAPGEELVAEVQTGSIIVKPARPPVWERIAALTADAPPAELAKLPADGAAQLDHYLYGAPRRSDLALPTILPPCGFFLRIAADLANEAAAEENSP